MLKTEKSTILQKTIKDKKFYHLTKSQEKGPVLYSKSRKCVYLLQQKDLLPFKKPRQKIYLISKIKKKYLLVIIKKLIILQKIKTKSLFYIKN